MNNKRSAYVTGFIVFIVLAILTGVEFYVASISGAVAGLMIIALIKAALIIWFFMHVSRLWAEEGHE